MKKIPIFITLFLFGCDFFPCIIDECWECIYQTYISEAKPSDTIDYNTEDGTHLTIIIEEEIFDEWVTVDGPKTICKSSGKNIREMQYVDEVNRIVCDNKHIISY